MADIFLSILRLIGLGDWLTRWLDQRQARQQGREDVELEITKEARDAKAREAADYAKPRTDTWADTVKRLQKPD